MWLVISVLVLVAFVGLPTWWTERNRRRAAYLTILACWLWLIVVCLLVYFTSFSRMSCAIASLVITVMLANYAEWRDWWQRPSVMKYRKSRAEHLFRWLDPETYESYQKGRWSETTIVGGKPNLTVVKEPTEPEGTDGLTAEA